MGMDFGLDLLVGVLILGPWLLLGPGSLLLYALSATALILALRALLSRDKPRAEHRRRALMAVGCTAATLAAWLAASPLCAHGLADTAPLAAVWVGPTVVVAAAALRSAWSQTPEV